MIYSKFGKKTDLKLLRRDALFVSASFSLSNNKTSEELVSYEYLGLSVCVCLFGSKINSQTFAFFVWLALRIINSHD